MKTKLSMGDLGIPRSININLIGRASFIKTKPSDWYRIFRLEKSNPDDRDKLIRLMNSCGLVSLDGKLTCGNFLSLEDLQSVLLLLYLMGKTSFRFSSGFTIRCKYDEHSPKKFQSIRDTLTLDFSEIERSPNEVINRLSRIIPGVIGKNTREFLAGVINNMIGTRASDETRYETMKKFLQCYVNNIVRSEYKDVTKLFDTSAFRRVIPEDEKAFVGHETEINRYGNSVLCNMFDYVRYTLIHNLCLPVNARIVAITKGSELNKTLREGITSPMEFIPSISDSTPEGKAIINMLIN